MTFYLDSCCIIRYFTRDGPLLTSWGRWIRAFSSELTRVEVRRVLYRAKADGRLDDRGLVEALRRLVVVEAGIEYLPIAPSVLGFASEPTPLLKTLDALHIATARQVRALAVPGLVFATHDRQMATAAVALGFPVEGYDLS